MDITPLAAESLGVRSMAVAVATDDIDMVIDPGLSLGPRRHGLQPHRKEYRALQDCTDRVLNHAKDADVLTISHYHFDHYVPTFETPSLRMTTEDDARTMYQDSTVLAKHTDEDINHSQAKRGYYVDQVCADVAARYEYADNQTFSFGETTITFSPPRPHGPEDTKLGWLLLTVVETPDHTLVHASDVQGPVAEGTADWILDQDPDTVIVDGPPTYLVPHKFDQPHVDQAQQQMRRLAQTADLLCDHHLMREPDYDTFLQPVQRTADRNDNTVQTFAAYRGEDDQFLEMRREELHENEPVDDAFYEKVEDGYFMEHDV